MLKNTQVSVSEKCERNKKNNHKWVKKKALIIDFFKQMAQED